VVLRKLIETKSVDAARKITIIGCALILMGLLGLSFLVDGESAMSFIYIVALVLFGFQFAIEICKPYQVICSKDHL
jgi:ACS family hexuronate transporter-like MFS transporter